MPRVVRPRAELEELLRRHYNLLKSSADAVDSGNEDEALHLALGVRVLVHDWQGRSLLGQLGLLKRIRFVDTALRKPAHALAMWPQGLVMVRVAFGGDQVSGFAPPLDDLSPERVQPGARFSEWWSERVVGLQTGDRAARRDVVLGMANYEGAHVDGAISREYNALLRDTGGFTFTSPDGSTYPPAERSLVAATVRQISHELIRTLERDWRTEAIIAA